MIPLKPHSLLVILVFCVALALVACGSAAKSIQPTADPFAYCAAVGTIDAPDARFTGPVMPTSIIQAMVHQGIVSADTPADFQAHAVWRCMDKKVWVCHFGANLPCQERADLSKTPSSAMADFCKANPSADVIPTAVTGRATVYDWSCQAGKAQAGKQVFSADPRGFLADFWHVLSPQ